MNKTPYQIYQQVIQNNEFFADPQQEKAILAFQEIYDQLLIAQKNNFLLHKIKHTFKRSKPVHGLYIWGSVGAGKTWLMDIFFKSLPIKSKLRLHFHHFMQQVHTHLKELQGQKDPLKIIAKRFAKQAKILCFDEFFVTDITDAMILGNLLAALFNEGVTLVTTSNLPPDELYRNGLQRNRFLPAIALLKKYTQILHLQSLADYRLRELTQAGVYFYPLNKENEQKIANLFQHLAHGSEVKQQVLTINNRTIETIAYSHNIVWFDFNILCHTPRSQLDYLEIAKTYHTVFLSNVPAIKANELNAIRYLINLIDILYDCRVKLIVLAEVAIPDIYVEGDLRFEFQRTCSRLLEMQSEHYLELGHTQP